MMDPNAPATQHLMRVLDDLRFRYASTLTLEECRQLAEQAEKNRRLRQLMFHPRPVDQHPKASGE